MPLRYQDAGKQPSGYDMSSLTRSDFRFIEELVEFIRGRGYVLDLSDVTFSEFFADNLNVDIDDAIYAENGGSKGKRLRTFLTKVDNTNAIKALEVLWAHRVGYLMRTGTSDPLVNAEGRYLTLIQRLNGSGPAGGEPPRPVSDRAKIEGFRTELYNLRDLPAQQRGYAFEDFLTRVFKENKLEPRQPFRNIGEQIDGSFVLDGEVYLLEAKWTQNPTPAADLRAFHGKLDKATWTRGVFISYTGFTSEGLSAYGRAQRLFCVEGRDLYEAFNRQIPLVDLLRSKIRRAAETGEPFVPLEILFPKP
ncbi:restriction endonuclease [Methylobacterium aquaticum]|uniref:restriction endonuclease n=1 Tax=Methylobacterium aquaticum TaxID=270351 RepID=UPI003D16B76C